MKTKKQLQEEIDKLRKELNEFKAKESRFEEVCHSRNKCVLLKSKEGNALVVTWGSKENLNDFEFFEKAYVGQFWIKGDSQPLELLIKGKWVRFDERIKGRFLKKNE